MDISMQVNGSNQTFDEEDIRDSGVSIGDAIGAAIDEELVFPITRTIVIRITV